MVPDNDSVFADLSVSGAMLIRDSPWNESPVQSVGPYSIDDRIASTSKDTVEIAQSLEEFQQIFPSSQAVVLEDKNHMLRTLTKKIRDRESAVHDGYQRRSRSGHANPVQLFPDAPRELSPTPPSSTSSKSKAAMRQELKDTEAKWEARMQDMRDGLRVTESRSNQIEQSVEGLREAFDRQTLLTQYAVKSIQTSNEQAWKTSRTEQSQATQDQQQSAREQAHALAQVTHDQQNAFEQIIRDQEASEVRLLAQIGDNQARMTDQIQHVIEIGDRRAQEAQQQFVADMEARQIATENRIAQLIGSVAVSGGRTLGDVEALLERQRELEAATKHQERLESDRKTREIAMDISATNTENFARIIGARFTDLEAIIETRQQPTNDS